MCTLRHPSNHLNQEIDFHCLWLCRQTCTSFLHHSLCFIKISDFYKLNLANILNEVSFIYELTCFVKWSILLLFIFNQFCSHFLQILMMIHNLAFQKNSCPHLGCSHHSTALIWLKFRTYICVLLSIQFTLCIVIHFSIQSTNNGLACFSHTNHHVHFFLHSITIWQCCSTLENFHFSKFAQKVLCLPFRWYFI